MPQRTKTRSEIVRQMYLNVTDISKIMGTSFSKAKKIYKAAEQLDIERMGEYRYEDIKVSMESVSKVVHMSREKLIKYVDDAEAFNNSPQEASA